MYRAALLASMAFVCACAQAAPADNCPTLPTDSGLRWEHHEGPDFDVCYAQPAGSQETLFGIYLGNWPSFKPDNATSIGGGTVGGRKVTWYKGADGKIARETLVPLGLGPFAQGAHIWVSAGTPEELKKALSVLERLRLQ